MGIDINFGALEQPNIFASYAKGQEIGDQNRLKEARRNAFSIAGTDPQKASEILMQAGDLDGASALEKRQRQQAMDTGRSTAVAQFGKGDTAGAIQTGLSTGNDELVASISKLSKEQRDLADANTDKTMGYLVNLKSIPDPAQRKQKAMADAQFLGTLGFTPQQIEAADYSDAGLTTIAGHTMGLKTALEQADKTRDFNLNVDKFGEEKRHNKADEGNAAGQLGVSRGQLGVAQARLGVERQRLQFDQQSKSNAVFDPETVRAMAQQAWQGDKSVFANLGRGTQGAQNIAALRKEIYAQGALAGKSPADLARMNAEFVGQTSAARTAGTRVGAATVSTEELPGLVQMSSEAYSKLPRTDLKPFNELQHMVASGTASPEQAAAYTADFAVINAYARAVSPTGQPHIADQQKAASLLGRATGQAEHQAVLNQIVRETAIIKAGATRALHPSGDPASAPAGNRPPLTSFFRR